MRSEKSVGAGGPGGVGGEGGDNVPIPNGGLEISCQFDFSFLFFFFAVQCY